ncbi:MAG: flagellar basal-body MS-ring/collar protein FliF [Gammaproteobacteria bacterium]
MSEQEAINSLQQANMQKTVANDRFGDRHPVLQGFSKLTMPRQIGLIAVAAVVVAMIVAVLLWTRSPSYDLLYPGLSDKEAAEVFAALQKMDVDYQVDARSGAIMVPAGKVHEVRLKLAGQGLPRSDSLGYELLDRETGFGVSRSAETVRFQRALEGEIARTVMSIQSVKNARVLLALPKQSVFVRQPKKPSASVLVNLYPGRVLEKEQVEAIKHLVASSVPLLESEQVTVADQTGRLLSATDASPEVLLTAKQFEYKKRLEDHLMERIENILTPVVGFDGMRAQITADIDFSMTETTQESYNPELAAVRSEQTQEEKSTFPPVQGVPGALSNQPPPAGIAPEVALADAAEQALFNQGSVSKSATRNFELDKTVSHTRHASGVLNRLSVAVVVDNRKNPLPDGSQLGIPYSRKELDRMTDLVKQAVGFDEKRGDQVTVTNTPFVAQESSELFPGTTFWDRESLYELIKPAAAVVIVLLLIFGVIKPVLQSLISPRGEDKKALEGPGERIAGYDRNGRPLKAGAKDFSSETEDLLLLEAPQSYEKRLEFVRNLVDKDPRLVAQVIKKWVAVDG